MQSAESRVSCHGGAHGHSRRAGVGHHPQEAVSSGTVERAAREVPGRALQEGTREVVREVTGGRKAFRPRRYRSISFKGEWMRPWALSGREQGGMVDLGHCLRVTDLKHSYWGSLSGDPFPWLFNARNSLSILN